MSQIYPTTLSHKEYQIIERYRGFSQRNKELLENLLFAVTMADKQDRGIVSMAEYLNRTQ